MRRFFKYIFILFIVIVISGIGFSFLEPMTQAKIFLRVAGVHNQNKEQLDGFKNLLLDKSYTKYSSLEELPDDYQQKLKRYWHTKFNDIKNLSEYPHIGITPGYVETPDSLDLKTIYAGEGDEWNPTDVVIDESLPRMQFRYAYCSDQSMILIVKVGGFGVSTAYETFVIENDTLVMKHLISYGFDNIFSLAFGLRFIKIDDFMNEPDSVLPEEYEFAPK